MRTLISGLIVLAFVFALTLGISSYAADSDGPSEADLEAIKSGIEYPKENEYLEEYIYATVKAPKGHSVLGFGSADHQGSVYTVLNGEQVKVLAERKGYSCCIVLSQDKGRWINSNYLEAIPTISPEELPEIVMSREK